MFEVDNDHDISELAKNVNPYMYCIKYKIWDLLFSLAITVDLSIFEIYIKEVKFLARV